MKGNSTLLDKIRSDFNSGSHKKDRVVQIRVGPSHPALATLSPPVMVGNQIVPAAESPTESEMAWLDLIAKFKTQILASFDARVSQYEEDIKEKDSQRMLPGWNFCTFFVLKEGLARAFESVGLVEDALVLYDELGFGLDAIVRDKMSKGGEEGEPEGVVGGTFVGWTKESIRWIEQARRRRKARLEGRKGEEREDVDDETPVGSEKKPYRELILSNEISLFDFKTYLFARQSTLLLRLGRGNATDNQELTSGTSGYSLHEAAAAALGKPEEDLIRLSEVLTRGVEFVTGVGRILRADLWTSYHSSTEGEKDKEQELKDVSWIIDNIVSSWVFAVCQQLLKQTASGSLPEGPKASTSTSSLPLGKFPKRGSSLPTTPTLETASFLPATQASVTGLEDFAAVRADLMLLARGIVETFGKQKGWVGPMGWFHLPKEDVKGMDMVDVDLESEGEHGALGKKEDVWGVEGIRNATLRRVVEKEQEEEFYAIFEELSEKAMKNYGVAKRIKSCERVEADLAALNL